MIRLVAFTCLFASTGALVPAPGLRVNKAICVPKNLNTGTHFEGRVWHASRATMPLLKAQSLADGDVVGEIASDNDRVRQVCVALLGRVSTIEEGKRDDDIKFDEFSDLVDTLVGIECTMQDTKTIFAMIDENRDGTISATEIMNAVRASGLLDSDIVRTVCIALLGQVAKLEEVVEEGDVDSELDFDGFSGLVDQLEIACTDQDKRIIFAMCDEDCGGTVSASEIKSAVRSSGAITKMYDDSLKTFGLLVAGTLVFDGGILLTRGATDAFDFLTAYAVEDSLSVDNLFVFLLLFRYFKVPPQLVDICLNYGITGSILLRGVFIYAGLAAANAFAPLNLFFSGFLIFSSYQLLFGEGDDDEDDEPPEIILNLLDKLPLTGTFNGKNFFATGKDGGLQATQLTATLLTLALSDVLFAVDSIPAVLAINTDPFIVYTSNIAAVIGLRSLYQLLSVAVADLVYLEKAVAVVLGFVGLKLALSVAGVEVSSAFSLGVILVSLTSGVVLSNLVDDDMKEAYSPTPQSGLLRFIKGLTGVERTDEFK